MGSGHREQRVREGGGGRAREAEALLGVQWEKQDLRGGPGTGALILPGGGGSLKESRQG